VNIAGVMQAGRLLLAFWVVMASRFLLRPLPPPPPRLWLLHLLLHPLLHPLRLWLLLPLPLKR